MNTTDIERSATNNLTLVTDYDYPNKVKPQQEQQTTVVYVCVITINNNYDHVLLFNTDKEAFSYIDTLKEDFPFSDYYGHVTKHVYALPNFE